MSSELTSVLILKEVKKNEVANKFECVTKYKNLPLMSFETKRERKKTKFFFFLEIVSCISKKKFEDENFT